MSGPLSKTMAESCITCDRLWNDLAVAASTYVKKYRRYKLIARRSNFPGMADLIAELQRCHTLRRTARKELKKHELTHPTPQFDIVENAHVNSKSVIVPDIGDERTI